MFSNTGGFIISVGEAVAVMDQESTIPYTSQLKEKKKIKWLFFFIVNKSIQY